MTKTLHLAKIIVSSEIEPLFNGAILIEENKIIKIGKKEDFGDLTNYSKVIDHGESLICPGFINLHTHLLYSNINKIDGEEGLFPWLEKLVDETSGYSEKELINSVRYGINEAISSGTTFIAENTPNNLSIQELAKTPLKALIGLEVFGSDEAESEKVFTKALEQMSKCHSQLDWESSSTTNATQSLDSHFRGNDTKRIDFTFSPHAPYDVSKPLWEKLMAWSEKNNKPLLTHLEESCEEKKWWQNKSGAGIRFWEKIDKLEPKRKYWKKYNSGIDFLEKNNLLSKKIIATHLCNATKEDLLTLKKHNVKLVHSPRSNSYLNNGTANIKLWDELGFLWGIGTDSLASNESLDLLNEIRFALRTQDIIFQYNIPAKEAFYALTSNAAKIISKDNEIGSLQPGLMADFLIYDIKEKSGCTYKDPYNLIIWELDNKKNLKEVWINGLQVWLAEHLLTKI